MAKNCCQWKRHISPLDPNEIPKDFAKEKFKIVKIKKVLGKRSLTF